MSDDGVFRRRTAAGVVLLGGIALAITLYFMIFGESPRVVRSARADTFSRSALGYHALVELLEKDVPIVVSRQHSAAKVSLHVPLLLLEPAATPDELEHLAGLLAAVRARQVPAVVVLPKWQGVEDRERRGWVRQVALLPTSYPEQVLAAVLPKDMAARPSIVRPERADCAWVQPPARSVAAPQLLFPQLLQGGGLEPVIASPEGALVARVAETPLYVVADPDWLNTAGLAQGDNALAAHQWLIGELQPKALVIDEVVHGYRRAQTLWRALLDFPLSCVTLHLAALLILVLWATTSRFGRPLPPPSRLPPGKLTLVDNTARLLAAGGHLQHALELYLQLTVRRAAACFALPQGLRFSQRVAALDRLGAAHGRGPGLTSLVARIDRGATVPRHALELARALFRWRKETCDGPHRRRRPG